MKICQFCGAQNSDNHNFCAGCGAPLNAQQTQQPIPFQQAPPQQTYQVPYQQPKQKKKYGCLIVVAAVIILFCIFCIVVTIIGANEDTENTVPSQSSEIVTEEITTSKEDYISACQQFTYKEIARNPNDYKGKLATFTGQVIQVQESESFGQQTVTIRVNVTAEENQFADNGYTYSDTVYVTYYPEEDESRVLEDDIITMYGELNGLETYTSIFGENISIPSMTAKYIEIKE